MIAKYAVELKGDGIKTLSLSPGWVETDAGTLLISLLWSTINMLTYAIMYSKIHRRLAGTLQLHVDLFPEVEAQYHGHDLY